jgi:non-heme chloroperoxidase
MPFIEVAPDVNLFVEDLGTGKPVVLLHGWPLSHEMYEYQVIKLIRHGYRCIGIDRRGFGQSDKPATGYDYDTLISDIQAVLEKLDVRDAALVGFSMGGAEALHYVARYGNERVSKLVLLGAAAPRMLKTEDFPDGVDQDVFDEMVENAEEDRAAFLEEFGKQFFGVSLLNKPLSTPLMQWFHALQMKAGPIAFTTCIRTFSEANLTADMVRIQIPTLVIHGTSDATVPIEITGRVLAESIPGAQLLEYDGAPHGFFYTHKDQLNGDLLAFLG